MTYQVVIPMTGVGQRFVDAGYKTLKPLIHVDGKSIVEHVLNMYTDAEKVICVISRDHEQKELLAAEICRIRPDSVVIEISKHKLGPGHAVLQAKSAIDPYLPVLVSYCDWAGCWNPYQMIEQLKNHSGSILTYTGFHPHMLRSTQFAYVRKSAGDVVDIQEKKPYTDSPMQEEASAGCYGFSTGSLLIKALEWQIDSNENLNGEFYLSLTYKNLLQNGERIGTVLMDKFYQWGTPEDLQDWEYWNNSINSLPGVAKLKIDSHNLVLAAGRGSRISDISQVSKPNISIEGQHLWEYSAPAQIVFRSNRVVTRPEVGLALREDVQAISVSTVTEGQAISARIGIDRIEDPGDYPINIMSSDNAFTPDNFLRIADMTEQYNKIVWTSKGYPPSQLNPKQYAWINRKSKKVLKKEAPPNFVDWEMLIGNFTFLSCGLALTLIEELILKNIRINDEYYLDSVIDLAFAHEIAVTTLSISNFLAIGTPEELLTYRYFARSLIPSV
jgi:bifunctional N-acetylglucosamine-1-phosphate-uridyltransferase/glucosamine-1-phosphate-acetyltransferase GlmU-like protein